MSNSGHNAIAGAVPTNATEVVIQKYVDGSANVRTSGDPGTLESYTFTIDGADDVITAPATPLAAEIIGATSTGQKQRCRVTWNTQQSIGEALAADIYLPACGPCMVTINAGTVLTAVSRFTLADIGGGDVATVDARHRMVGPGVASIEFDLRGTTGVVEDVWVGALPPLDGGETTPIYVPVYVSVEIW